MLKLTSVIFVSLILQGVVGRQGFGPTDQEWGHSTVRRDAHIFWWLHYTTANVAKPTERPLVIWLQGGPGSSSTGYGNFAEIGPLDLDLESRNTSWVQWVNLLFVDNPAGTGFGYVENGQYAVKNSQIADDFLVFLKDFYKQLPQFEGVPLYIFCESYGGKMTAEIALLIYKAQKNGEIPSNIKGVGLGDSWISPIDSIMTYAPYLLNLGIVDQDGHDKIMEVAKQTKNYVDKEDFVSAYGMWGAINEIVDTVTVGIDFYNVLVKIVGDVDMKRLNPKPITYFLEDIMNEKVKPALNLSQTYVDYNYHVTEALGSDFMRPVTNIVEELLNTTDINVAVYNGQLDLIVDTPGTMKWVEALNFKHKELWKAAPRSRFVSNIYYEGYEKIYGKFAFYWVDRAGHMVPLDNPSAMEYILRQVTNNFEV